MLRIYCLLSCLFLSVIHTTCAANLTDNLQAAPGTVALTFDDGPTSKYTAGILAILKKYNIKATFFVIGQQAVVNPGMLAAEVHDGHAIGNHTMTHPYLTKLSDQQIADELRQSQDIIVKQTNQHPTCMRYPHRDVNEHVSAIVRSNGLTPIGIDVDSEDYRQLGVKRLVDHVVKLSKSGSVILFHDGKVGSDDIFKALPLIIEGIKQKGLGFSQICAD